MNSIKVNGNNDIELVRTTLRPDVGREPDPQALAHPEGTRAQSPPDTIIDVINLSSRATAIRNLVEQARQLPDVRSERVEHFRSLLQKDAYHLDAPAIADAMLKKADN